MQQGETAQGVSNRKIKTIKIKIKKKRGEKQNNNACSVGWRRLVFVCYIWEENSTMDFRQE